MQAKHLIIEGKEIEEGEIITGPRDENYKFLGLVEKEYLIWVEHQESGRRYTLSPYKFDGIVESRSDR